MTNPLLAVSLISSALRCTALRPHCVSSHRDHASGPPDLANDLQCRDSGLVQRTLRNVWPLCGYQSAFAPENFMTFPHFSVSSAMRFPYSAGERASTVPLRSAKRAFILGSVRAALISLLSLSTISVGVSLG